MVVTTGFFDGLHLGHRKVIESLVSCSRQMGQESRIVTFWPHPRNVLQNDARNLRLLTSLSEKKEMLKAMGVDHVDVIDFTKDFSHLTAREYFEDYVKGRYEADTIVLGYDNLVGCDCKTPQHVLAAAAECGLKAIVVEDLPYGPEGLAISSTRIRKALEKGEVTQAADMLGYNYSLKGVVVAGNRMGRTIGFPTANTQLYEPLKLVPANGVYSVAVETLGGHFKGMCNIGVRPTLGENLQKTIEVNIFDFDEDIYGLDIKIDFLKKIRDEKKFSSLVELACQLALDREGCL